MVSSRRIRHVTILLCSTTHRQFTFFLNPGFFSGPDGNIWSIFLYHSLLQVWYTMATITLVSVLCCAVERGHISLAAARTVRRVQWLAPSQSTQTLRRSCTLHRVFQHCLVLIERYKVILNILTNPDVNMNILNLSHQSELYCTLCTTPFIIRKYSTSIRWCSVCYDDSVLFSILTAAFVFTYLIYLTHYHFYWHFILLLTIIYVLKLVCNNISVIFINSV